MSEVTPESSSSQDRLELETRFKVRSPLRCDGVGSLECAEEIESGRRMAIRWMPLTANGEQAAKTVEQLPQHPTLPRIRGSGRVGEAAYVAMEFPEGKLLSTLLGEPLSAELVAVTGGQISAALGALHAQGMFHGELSADSLLLLPEAKSILWDMPLVLANRLTDRRGEEREMAQLTRVAPFLAPERARGLPASAAGDVYALGAVLCLAAGGRDPAASNTLAVLHQIATGQWTPHIPDTLPADLRLTLQRMLSPEPLARPTATEASRLLNPPAPEPVVESTPVTDPEAAVIATAPTLIPESGLEVTSPMPVFPPPVPVTEAAAPALTLAPVAPSVAAEVELFGSFARPAKNSKGLAYGFGAVLLVAAGVVFATFPRAHAPAAPPVEASTAIAPVVAPAPAPVLPAVKPLEAEPASLHPLVGSPKGAKPADSAQKPARHTRRQKAAAAPESPLAELKRPLF